MPKGFLKNVGGDGFQVVAEQIAQPEVLLSLKVLLTMRATKFPDQRRLNRKDFRRRTVDRNCARLRTELTMLRYEICKLTASKKNAEPDKEFGLPEQRKYPVPDASHARNAKARASQMEHQGKLSAADKKNIDAKADKILAK